MGGKMKLAVVCGEAPVPRETFLRRDIAVLQTRFDVRVFGLARRAPTLRNLPLLAGHPLRGALALALRLRTVREVADYVADGGAILAHFAWTTADIAAAAARLSGRPWFCFVHAWDVFTRPAAELRRRTATAARVVACSRAAADALATAGIDRARTSVIHHAVFPVRSSEFSVLSSQFSVQSSQFTPKNRNQELGTRNQELGTWNQELGTRNQELGTRNQELPPRPPAVAAVGRLVEKKGFDTLLRAWPEVVRALPGARLRIVGDGPCAARLRHLAESLGGRDAPIDFAGALSEEDALRAIAASDLFVLPSRRLANGDRDGIPNAVLEAMALGVPVVTTDAGAAGEAVTHNVSGLLLPSPATPGALASAIVRLARDDALRATLARNAAAVVREHFSADGYLDSVSDLLAPLRARIGTRQVPQAPDAHPGSPE